MTSILRTPSQKHAPKRNYFGAISEKFMRLFKKVLARVFPAFLRHILLDCGAEIRGRRSDGGHTIGLRLLPEGQSFHTDRAI
ncbi:hypothetical protein [Porphyromonas loveana]|uniref:hypothetical protein n=1 Tax=Porphyromonas loveana TaxID=1884669 RepID=UPI0035A0A274